MKRLDIDPKLVEAGLDDQQSYAQIANGLNCSVTTIQRVMRQYGLRRRPLGFKYDIDPPKHHERQCKKHGLTMHRLSKTHDRRWYRCMKCDTAYTRERAAEIKQILVDERGGKCEQCGYDRCIAALQFHHRDPAQKAAQVSKLKSLTKARAEAKKCDLLCSNCHDEITFASS
jgi:hypothetical protein